MQGAFYCAELMAALRVLGTSEAATLQSHGQSGTGAANSCQERILKCIESTRISVDLCKHRWEHVESVASGVASNDVSPELMVSELIEVGPCISAETVKCALIGLHVMAEDDALRSDSDSSPDLGDMWRYGHPKA